MNCRLFKEREAIIARKEELKEMREKQKRALLVDFDLDKGTVTEVRSSQILFFCSFLIFLILQRVVFRIYLNFPTSRNL